MSFAMMNQTDSDLEAIPRQRYTAATIRILFRVGLIVLVTVIAYAPALRSKFVWDDLQNVTANQSLRSADGLKQIWVNPHASYQYYPLTYTSFWIEYHLWGLLPFGYHLVNILLHALNAFLLGTLLSRLSVPGAWFAALIFAVHPVHVESVAWITERKNVLSALFCLASFLAYLRFTSSAEGRWRWYAFSFVLFSCALLAKTSTAVLPVAIFLALWWKQKRFLLVDGLRLLPFLLLSGALGRITIWVEEHDVGAQGPEWTMRFAQRILIAGRAVSFYAGKLVWPHPLMFIYPRWQINPASWWQYFFPAAVILLLGLLWLFRKRIGKGPFAAMLLFTCAAAPVPAFISLFFMYYSYVADHFQYLASMSLIALVAAGVWRALRSDIMRTTASGLIILSLLLLSWQHCGAFYNDETLWRDTAAKNPDCWLAHEQLTDILFNQGRIEEAAAENAELLRIRPDYGFARNYLGVFLARQGKYDEALTQFTAAVHDQPWNAFAHNHLGQALAMQGKLLEAMREFVEALRLDPNLAEAHNNLGLALATEGNIRGAIAQFREALRLKPDYPVADANLGKAFVQTGQLDEALHCLETLENLAAAHASAGEFDDAVRAAQQAHGLAIAAGKDILAAKIKSELEQYRTAASGSGAKGK